MKVLLIQPPIEDFYTTRIRTQPIGLCYIASVLQQEGIDVEILDCITDKKKEIPYPSQFLYLKEFYSTGDTSPFKLFSKYYRFGMKNSEILDRIGSSHADLIGISANFTAYFSVTAELAQLIKRVFPEKPVIMGGSHISVAPFHLFENISADYFIRGEGEYIFRDLVRVLSSDDTNLLKKIKGLIFKDNGSLCVNEKADCILELNQIPFPARNLINFDQYRINGRRSTMLITSRGCPYRCAFCNVNSVFGRKFRIRTAENVIDEIKSCYENYGIDHFDIEDDCFLKDRKRARKILEGIIENFGKRQLRFSAMNGIVWGHLDDELMKLLYDAGFSGLNLSLVSTKRETRRKLHRPSEPKRFTTIIKDAKKEGLPVIAYIILGLPGTQLIDILNDIIFLMRFTVLIGPSVFYPVISAEQKMYFDTAQMSEEDFIYYRSSGFSVIPRGIKRKELITAFMLCRIINFVKEFIDLDSYKEISLKKILASEFDKIKKRINIVPFQYGYDIHIKKNKTFLSRIEIGIVLLQKILSDKKIYGIKKIKNSDEARNYKIYPLKYDPETVVQFLTLVKDKKVHGYRTDNKAIW